ncbi:MAG: hypothetical protein IFK94_06015, partial [Acidobacteria bacterium]|nr:hypothetical protein [Candidatus Polarisedimenticola svalbardensis]
MRQRRIFGSAVVLSVVLLLFLPQVLGGERTTPFKADGLEAIATRPGSTGYAFRVSSPEVRLTRNGDGTRSIAVTGYPILQVKPGVPQIPTRMVRVAIPAGVTPTLEVRPGVRQVLSGVQPRSVPFLEHTVEPGGHVSERRVQRREQEVYLGRRPFPLQIAWLGEYGTLRDQRYVELFLAPVRFDPGLNGLEVFEDLEVEVLFDVTPGPAEQDPVFEDLYRNAFVNYAQGATFRLGSDGQDPVMPVSASLAVDSLTGTRYRILVREYGVVQLDFPLMSGTDLISEPLSTWSVISQGVQVPVNITDQNGNGFMDNGDWVHFYVQPMDEEPKARINQDYPAPAVDLYEAADFTDENTYFVGIETGTVARMALQPSSPTFTRTPPSSFIATARAETDETWRPLGGEDPWYWAPTLDSADPANSRVVSETVSLPGLADVAGPLTIRVNVRGLSTDPDLNPDHSTRITLRNALSQQLIFDDADFDDRTLHLHDLSWAWTSGPLATDPMEVETEVRAIASG